MEKRVIIFIFGNGINTMRKNCILQVEKREFTFKVNIAVFDFFGAREGDCWARESKRKALSMAGTNPLLTKMINQVVHTML